MSKFPAIFFHNFLGCNLTLARTKKILSVSTPIILGMLSKNILGLVDTAMIGFLGNYALAAAGIGSLLFFFYTSIFLGITESIQVYVARYFGASQDSDITKPFNTGLLIVIIVSLFFTAIAWLTAPIVFFHMNPNPIISDLGVRYFRWLCLGLTPLCIIFSYRSYWNGINKPLQFLAIIASIHAINIILNYLLIFGNFGFPKLGIEGAGIATFIALSIGCITFFIKGFFSIQHPGYLRQLCSFPQFKELIKTALPVSIQELFFVIGLLYYFWIIGHLGHQSVAIAHVQINIILLIYLPGLGFGLTALSFVSQSLGIKNNKEAKNWATDIAILASVFTLGFGLIGLIFPREILSIFFHDPTTISMAIATFRLDCLTIWIEIIGLVFSKALIASGKASSVLTVSIATQLILFAPLAYLFGPVLHLPLVWIVGSLALHQSIATLLYIWLWKRRFNLPPNSQT
jgi:MATE family multidrug resistance protein